MLKSIESEKTIIHYEFSESIANESIRSCLELIEKLAAKYKEKTTMTHAQLRNLGRSALAKAIECFHVDQGLPFCTHAAWWITQAMELKVLLLNN